METTDGMSKIYKRQQRLISSQLVIIAIGFLVFVVSLVGLHINKEREVAYRIDTLELLDVAADDFGSGLLGLSMTPDSDALQQAYYVGRIQSALHNFTTVSERLNNNDLRDKFRALLRDFQTELNDEDGSPHLNDQAYSFQSQVHLLERQLMRNLINDRETQQFWFFVSLFGTILVMGFIILAMLRSEYRRNRIELELRQSEGRFLELAERIDEIFWLEDLQSNELVYLSPAFERVYGVSIAEVVENTERWFDCVHPDDKADILALRERSFYEPVVMEYRIIRPDGAIRWINDRVFPIYLEGDDPTGKASRLAAVASDVTEHKELSQQLFVSQKMEALGQLTGGISHDFNNLLTVIMNNAELLAWQLADDDRLKRTAQLIIKASERSARLNQQLLAFSRKQDLHPEMVEMRGLLEETVELLERTLPARYCDKAMALFAQLAEERNLKLSQFDGRIFGGGQLTAGERMRSVLGEEQLRPVGQKNATAAFQALLAYGVNIKEADVGEFGYRKVRLNLLNGECEVQFEAC
jgi:PAS domain S-box-containing protein